MLKLNLETLKVLETTWKTSLPAAESADMSSFAVLLRKLAKDNDDTFSGVKISWPETFQDDFSNEVLLWNILNTYYNYCKVFPTSNGFDIVFN